MRVCVRERQRERDKEREREFAKKLRLRHYLTDAFVNGSIVQNNKKVRLKIKEGLFFKPSNKTF